MDTHAPSTARSVLTIGHSNRSIDAFLELTLRAEIERIVDVRRFPGSRRLPWFGADQLGATLHEAGIDYEHVPGLGGRRAAKDAPGSEPGCGDAWRNASFRAYACYTGTGEYGDALELLLDRAAVQRCAIMCSEAVPWRCHRWLISDTLVARGVDVVHVLDGGPKRRHVMTSFSRCDDIGRVTWPGPESSAKLRMGPPVEISAVAD